MKQTIKKVKEGRGFQNPLCGMWGLLALLLKKKKKKECSQASETNHSGCNGTIMLGMGENIQIFLEQFLYVICHIWFLEILVKY